MWTQPCGVRWGEMVEWDSGGMRDSNRLLFLREIREREKVQKLWEEGLLHQQLFPWRGIFVLHIDAAEFRSKTHIMCF